jgi:hypothetical protein
LDNNIYTDYEALHFDVTEVLLELHKKYNTRWSEKLEKETVVFEPRSILGVRLKDTEYGLYKITFNPNPWMRKIKVYDTTGSDQSFVDLILKQNNRIVNSQNKTFSDMPLEYSLWLAIYSLAQIKEFDRNSGGLTKVAILDN